MCQYKLAVFKKAISDFSIALMIKNNRDYYYYWRGMANNANNSFLRAIIDFSKAIEFNKVASYFNKRGMVYLTIG